MADRSFQARLTRLLKATVEEFYLIELGYEPEISVSQTLNDNGQLITFDYNAEGRILNTTVLVKVVGDGS
jgi:hypothetical protein